MAKSDGTVLLDTRIDTKGFQDGMKSINSQTGSMISAFGKLGKTIASAFAIKQIIQFGKKAIDLGSDLQEVQNVVDVTFTTMSDKVNEFAKAAAESAGLSETMAKRYVGTFGAMSKAFGFAEGEAFSMSTALTQLSGDVASFYNITQDEAYTKLKSVFTGETESLKDLGVVMTQSALDSFAMAEGLGKTTKQMTEQEKVALRYRFVLNQLSGAQGDFARTSDSWANQIRLLKLNIESIMASIGKVLIVVFTPIVKIINVLLSKISALASSFASFFEMLTGKQISGGGGGGIAQTANDLQEVSAGYGGAAENANELADATKKADKANQKYLSGLDEIRTFTSKNNEAEAPSLNKGGAGSGGGGGIADFGNVESGNNILEKTNSTLDAMISRLKELAGLFKKGFIDGLGNVTKRLETIKKSAKSIKESLSYIFDSKTGEAFSNMLDTFAYSFGQIVGSISSIGLTIGANLTGGIAKYLESDKDRIKQYLLDMMNVSGELIEQAGEYADSFAYIFEVISSESGQQITSDIIGIFSEIFMTITELAATAGTDIFTAVTQPIIDNKEELKKSFQELLDGLSEVTATVKEVFSDLSDFTMAIYNTVIKPIIDNIKYKLSELIEEHVAPLFEKVGKFLSNLGTSLSELWNKILKPLIQWIIANILPVLVPIIDGISNAVFTVIGGIMDLIGHLLDILNGLIDFVTGVFTGDWERAWNGIKEIFSGIINSITTILETFVNGATDIINGIIGGINKITGKIGIDIPTIPELDIPKLAKGAVIPPNAPFMAMLGDQKHGTNIEAPLDTIKQAVREVVGNGGVSSPIHAHLYLDGKEIFDTIIDQARFQQAVTGKNKFATL